MLHDFWELSLLIAEISKTLDRKSVTDCEILMQEFLSSSRDNHASKSQTKQITSVTGTFS